MPNYMSSTPLYVPPQPSISSHSQISRSASPDPYTLGGGVRTGGVSVGSGGKKGMQLGGKKGGKVGNDEALAEAMGGLGVSEDELRAQQTVIPTYQENPQQRGPPVPQQAAPVKVQEEVNPFGEVEKEG
jgi:hypothetical protein